MPRHNSAAVLALVNDRVLTNPEDRSTETVVSWVRERLAAVDSTGAPHAADAVGSDLARRVEAVALANGVLFPDLDEVVHRVAQDLLREYWELIRSRASYSPSGLDVDRDDSTDRTDAREQQFQAHPAVVTFRDAWVAAHVSLLVTGRVTRSSPLNDARTFKGTRVGSFAFDNWFTGTVVPREKPAILAAANAALASLSKDWPYTATLIDVWSPKEGSSPQGQQTNFCDLWIEIRFELKRVAHVEIVRFPVNVKYAKREMTRKSNNNTGGSQMLAWAMLGDAGPKNGKTIRTYRRLLDALYDRDSDGNLTRKTSTGLPASDYFFFAVEKGSATKRPIGEVWVSSLLTVPPDGGALYFNPSQSWPHLQMDWQRATKPRITDSLDDARVELLEWINAGLRKVQIERELAVPAGVAQPGVDLTAESAAALRAAGWTTLAGYQLHPDDIRRAEELLAKEGCDANP